MNRVSREDKYAVYQKLLDEIYHRSDGGKFECMSLKDKLTCKRIMTDIKKDFDEVIKEYYPILESWANLDLDAYIKYTTTPDLVGIRNMMQKFGGFLN